MDRRSFLKYSGISALVVASGVGGYLSFLRISRFKLSQSVASLFDPVFEEAAMGKEIDDLVSVLMSKGVIDENDALLSEVMHSLATTDEAVPYNGRYYTQTEMELYSLAYLLG